MAMTKSSCILSAIAAVLCALILLTAQVANAEETVKVLRIDPDARAAVVKKDDGRLKVIRVGDRVPPHGRVQSISDGRIVFKNDRAEKIILELKDGKETIGRFARKDDASAKPPVHGVSAASGKGEGGSVVQFSRKKKSEEKE